LPSSPQRFFGILRGRAIGIRVSILASGSSGNLTLIETETTRVLVDAGLGKRETIGAWLMCLAIAVGCFSLLAAAGPDSGVAPAALINPGPIATVAAVQDHRPGRC